MKKLSPHHTRIALIHVALFVVLLLISICIALNWNALLGTKNEPIKLTEEMKRETERAYGEPRVTITNEDKKAIEEIFMKNTTHE